MESFVSHLEEDAAAKMLERWMVNEKESATPENLLNALAKLGLMNLVQGIFWFKHLFSALHSSFSFFWET